MILYDAVNVETYNTKGEEGSYICSMCGEITSLDGSMSSRGYNLICMHCYNKLIRITGKRDIMIDIQNVGERREERGN